MSDNKSTSSASVDTYWLAAAIVFVFCYGDPDLLDALIHWLMK